MPDIKELTPERAMELLREVVAEYGEDHVYTTPAGQIPDRKTTCYYVHGDQPGCIAGHVYHRAGLSLKALASREGEGASSSYFRDLHGISPRVSRLLRRAQIVQDEGGTWGEALAEAEGWYSQPNSGAA